MVAASDRPPSPSTRIVAIFRRALNGLWRDEVMFYAAAIAFNSLFSIFALLFLGGYHTGVDIDTGLR